MGEVRSWWIVWRSGYRNQATVTVDKPKEYNDTLTEVIAKADLQPKFDNLKSNFEVGDEQDVYAAALDLLKAWESTNS